MEEQVIVGAPENVWPCATVARVDADKLGRSLGERIKGDSKRQSPEHSPIVARKIMFDAKCKRNQNIDDNRTTMTTQA